MEIEILSDIHFVSTSLMVGIIWVIQLLHYPAFNFIKESDYVEFQHFHMQRISFIVVPVMILELFSAFMLVYYFRSNLLILCLIILLFIWLITFVFFTKLHQSLLDGYDKKIVDKLVKINWSRTVLWSLRLIILIYI
ncbi:MAG: hypothetical protein ACJZ1Y_06965 [Candidatus Neomarinimicrobiota bacterium]